MKRQKRSTDRTENGKCTNAHIDEAFFSKSLRSYRSPGTRTESAQWYRTLTPFQSNVLLPASRLRNCTRGSAHVTDFPVDVSLLFHTADRILHCSQSLPHLWQNNVLHVINNYKLFTHTRSSAILDTAKWWKQTLTLADCWRK